MAESRIPEMPVEMEDSTTDVDGVQIIQRGENTIVDFAPGTTAFSRYDKKDHSGNQAEGMDKRQSLELAIKVIDYWDSDIRSRKDWEARIEQGLELLGLQNKPLEELPFEGAASLTYPLIGEACVQFQARAIGEAFPSDGPVKSKVIGKKTLARQDQADRVSEHMNWQITTQDKGYFWNTDQMLFYLPLEGSSFKKTWFDVRQNMLVSRLIHSKDFAVPYMATDLKTAGRYTHRFYATKEEMEKYFASGFYREIELPDLNTLETATDTMDDFGSDAEDVADDRTPVFADKDSAYEILECHVDLSFKWDSESSKDFACPYIVSVCKDTQEVLSIRRNWKEGDLSYQKRCYFTHYKYLPGLGFYGFGLLHLIGSIAEGATGTLRALLDSAAFSNMQGGFVSADAKLAPGETHISPGVYKQVNMTADELARAFYTPNFKEPSNALGRLFEVLIEAGRRFASTTEEMVGDAPNTGPVGTTVALIEQGSMVYSGVHKRIHMAQAEEFQLRAELNFEFLDGQYPYEVEEADRTVFRSDYDGRVDVIPVSDPNIFSNSQRLAQGQAVLEVAERFPDVVSRQEAVRRLFKAMRIPDADGLIAGNETARMDPVNENMTLLTGGSVKAFAEQDHDAHLAVHMAFMGGLNEDALNMMGMALQAHLAEHYALKYYTDLNRQLGGILPPPTFMDEESEEEIDPAVEAQIAQMAAQIPQIELMPQEEGEGQQEDEEFAAEEQRKREAFDAEEVRKEEAFKKEQVRRDLMTDNEINRNMKKNLATIAQEEELLDLRKKQQAAQGARGSGGES